MESRRSPLTPARRRRLAEELADESVGFIVRGEDDALLDELDYALRPAVHERRIPSYGSIVLPSVDPAAWGEVTDLVVHRRRTVEFQDAAVRRFADGFSSWAVRHQQGVDELIVFDRAAGSERDLVVLARATGARLVQRHPTGTVRVVGEFGVVRTDVGEWHHEPPLESWIDSVPGCLDETNRTALGRMLDFAVHDLGARGVGSLLIFHPAGRLAGGHEERLPTPPELCIDRPHDLAPLRHALSQTDGATVFSPDGVVRAMGVRLVPSRSAELDVAPVRGTRHTSALRYSADDPDAVVVVVSDDGPVTVMRAGEVLGRSPADANW